MTDSQFILVGSGLIFFLFVYVMNWKRTKGRWPSVRNPFYTKD